MKYFHIIILSTILNANLYAQEEVPTLEGKVLYHSYTNYNNWDSEMYILNLSDNTVSKISANWNIDHEMNGVFSPDGTKIVFMGDQKNEPRNWDIFLWTIGGGEPVNLTPRNEGRDEDPKFSPDGTKIVFKADNDIKVMDLNGNILNNVTNTPDIEESMPYYTTDGSTILFAPGAGAESDIYSINTDGTNRQAIVAQPNYQEYFPITRDSESFFYTGWVSTTDAHDQLFLKYFSNPNPIKLPFNNSNADYSDATPVGSQYVVLSSTRTGGKGGYDLYIADIFTGDIWSLNNYNHSINSELEELGANYFSGITNPGCSTFDIPGIIEAENYCTMSGVVTEPCSDTGGGLDVGGVVKGDWMEYKVNVTNPGTYTVTYRIATTENGSKIQIQEDGTILATTSVQNTGGWQNWQSVSTTISLSAGLHTIKIEDTEHSWNLNWVRFRKMETVNNSM
ncbi:MAG: carbohydrate-binding protein [Methylococcales bacterium]|nr:carbohydrate-binding protein [Methylococcales bacterium]